MKIKEMRHSNVIRCCIVVNVTHRETKSLECDQCARLELTYTTCIRQVNVLLGTLRWQVLMPDELNTNEALQITSEYYDCVTNRAQEKKKETNDKFP